MQSEFISRSVRARLQVSVCSGYDLCRCRHRSHPDTQSDTDIQHFERLIIITSLANRAKKVTRD